MEEFQHNPIPGSPESRDNQVRAEDVVQALLNMGKTFRAPFQAEPKLLVKVDALFEIANHNGSVINPLKEL